MNIILSPLSCITVVLPKLSTTKNTAGKAAAVFFVDSFGQETEWADSTPGPIYGDQ